MPSDPLNGSKIEDFAYPPLMFWACPVETTARGSKKKREKAVSHVKLPEGANFPPLFQKWGVNVIFVRLPLKMFNENSVKIDNVPVLKMFMKTVKIE